MNPLEWAGLAVALLSTVGGIVTFFTIRERQLKADIHEWAKELFAPVSDLARLEQKVTAIETDIREVKDLALELLRRVPPREQ